MSSPTFRHIEAWLDTGVLVLTMTDKAVQGEDIAGALREEMLAALVRYPATDVLVDFQRTQYISSVAFWPLLSLYRKLVEKKGRLTVCGLSPTVGDVFYTTRLIYPGGALASPFGVEPDVATAVAHLSGASTG